MGDKPFCDGNGTPMYHGFSTSHRDCLIFLVHSWVLNERWKYSLACIATFFLAFLSQLLIFFRKYTDINQIGGYKERLRPWKLILNTLISGLTLGAGFIIMLIVMTYDLGFLAAVLCGLMTGQMLTAALLTTLRSSPVSDSTFTELTSVDEDP